MGNPSARVRDELWQMALLKAAEGLVLQIWSEHCPQGYRWRVSGPSKRQLVDFEGLALVHVEGKEGSKKPRGG